MRKSGILLPVSSLPSQYGIGTLGSGAYDFIDFLSDAGQYYWQILPVNPTAYGDSPYQSPSAFAGNPYFIDPGLLYEKGLISDSERRDAISVVERVDYGALYRTRHILLEKAASGLKANTDYERFIHENANWLDDYALFTVLRQDSGVPLSDCMNMTQQQRLNASQKLSRQIELKKGVQYLFFSQWFNLKKYANTKGVHIIGDIPIYVAPDSADVWSSPRLFLLNDDGSPRVLAGCPPDDFSADGQLWGNPMYDWKLHKAEGYRWWLDRLKMAQSLFDAVRIDHFRGFYSGYAVPAGATNARNREWIDGPGMDFVCAVRAEMPQLDVIAEDLGFVTPAVRRFFDESGFPGMKLLLFAFDGDELPHTFPRESVVYTGTHDNATAVEWMCTAPGSTVGRAMDYLGVSRVTQLPEALVRAALASVCDTAVIPMSDWLKLGAEGRINTPATAQGNWTFRLNRELVTSSLAQKIHTTAELYGRI